MSRLRQKGLNHTGDNYLDMSVLTLFGSLVEWNLISKQSLNTNLALHVRMYTIKTNGEN
jgi:hypothetical protein